MLAGHMVWGTATTFTWTLTDAADQAAYIGGILRDITIECNDLAQTITAGMANTNSLTTLRTTVDLTCELQTIWLVTRDLTDEMTTILSRAAEVAGPLGPDVAATAEVAKYLTSSLTTSFKVADTLCTTF
jgi:hypothetical protein